MKRVTANLTDSDYQALQSAKEDLIFEVSDSQMLSIALSYYIKNVNKRKYSVELDELLNVKEVV